MTYRRLFSVPNARLYLIGQALSFLGDSAMWMACGIWVKTLTDSNSAAGLTFFFYTFPAIFAPFVGLIVDRVRRRPFLVGANIVGILILTPLFLVNGTSDVWVIYAVMFCYGTVGIAIGTAQSALLTRLLPDELLAVANGTLRSIQEILRLFAPLVGAGIFVWLGGPAVVILDIATFAAAAALTWKVSVHEPRQAPEKHIDLISNFTAGLRFIINNVKLRRMTIASALFMLVAGFGTSVRWAIVADGLHRKPGFVSVVQLAVALGAVSGGTYSSNLVRKYGEGRLMSLGMLLFATGVALTAFPSLPMVLSGAAISGAGTPMLVIAALTLLQRTSPNHLQGRVYAGFELAVTVPQAASIAIGAWLVTQLNYGWILMVMTTGALICAFLALRIGRAQSTILAAPDVG